MMDFKSKYDGYLNYINEELDKHFVNSSSIHEEYFNKVLRYSLLSGGKRIRPILNILFFENLGGKRNQIVKLSIAIEMIHTYSLIHDDLPSMDDDDFRRGNKSSHIKFNESSAILAGDALLNYAFELLLDYLGDNLNENSLEACKLIAKSSGKSGMILGQVADMELAKPNNSLDNLNFINLKKTGKLINASIKSSGLVLGLEKDKLDLLERLSNTLGLAFQIKDDLLEIEGDEEKLGKPTDSDLKNKKKTYTFFYGVDETKKYLDRLKIEAEEILNELEIKDKFLKQVINYIFVRES